MDKWSEQPRAIKYLKRLSHVFMDEIRSQSHYYMYINYNMTVSHD